MTYILKTKIIFKVYKNNQYDQHQKNWPTMDKKILKIDKIIQYDKNQKNELYTSKKKYLKILQIIYCVKLLSKV